MNMSNKESEQQIQPWMKGLIGVLLLFVGIIDLISAEYLDATMEIALGAAILSFLFPEKRWALVVQSLAAIAIVMWIVLWLGNYIRT